MRKIKTATLTLTLFLLSITSILAIDYNGIGGVPAYPKDDNPRTESIFIYENAPGSVVQDGVVVINNTKETKTILVYATDTTPSSGGGFACKQFSEEVTGEGTWFDLSKTEVTLEGGTNQIVPFTVNIPKEVSAGEHNACIVIQEKRDESTDPGVNLSFRAAIRAMITIPGDITRELAIKTFSYIKTDNDKNTLNLVLANTGNVSLDTNIKIDVKNYFTGKLFFTNESEYSILHSNEQDFNYDLDSNPWGGVYQATANVTYDGISEQKTLTQSLYFLIMPSIYASALYLASLVIVTTTTLLLVINKKKTKKLIKRSREYIVKQGDTLTSIGKEENVNWKLLAKINNKKAPYQVSAGERLLIPIQKKKVETKTHIETNTPPIQPVEVAPTVTPQMNTQNSYNQQDAITPAASPSSNTPTPPVV